MGKRATCRRFKTVRVKGQGYAKRCADYTVHRGYKSKKRKARASASRRKKRPYGRRRRRPFNKGKTCVRMSMHFNKRAGRMVAYCASWGASPEWRKRAGKRGRGRHVDSSMIPGGGYIPPGVRPVSTMDRLKAWMGRREAEFSGLGRYGW